MGILWHDFDSWIENLYFHRKFHYFQRLNIDLEFSVYVYFGKLFFILGNFDTEMKKKWKEWTHELIKIKKNKIEMNEDQMENTKNVLAISSNLQIEQWQFSIRHLTVQGE